MCVCVCVCVGGGGGGGAKDHIKVIGSTLIPLQKKIQHRRDRSPGPSDNLKYAGNNTALLICA